MRAEIMVVLAAMSSSADARPRKRVTPKPRVVAPLPAPEPLALATPEPPVEIERHVVRAARVELSIDDGPVMRRLRYRDDWQPDGNDVRDYALTANAIAIEVVVRPWRELPGGELVARGERMTGVIGSAGPDAEVFATRSSELQVGARYTFDVGVVRGGLGVHIGQHLFDIADEMSMHGELVPDTTYRFVRWGALASVPVTDSVRVTTALGYRELFQTGDLVTAQWFPRATGGGIDAALGVELALGRVSGVVVRGYVRGQVRRYFFAMNPEVGDALIVGGAVDQYLSVVAGLCLAAF